MAVGGAAYLVSKAIKASKVLAFPNSAWKPSTIHRAGHAGDRGGGQQGTSVHETGPKEWRGRIGGLR